MTIGERIALKRIEKGWSQAELAKRMGYSDRSAIAMVETGRKPNKISTSKRKVLILLIMVKEGLRKNKIFIHSLGNALFYKVFRFYCR